MIRHSKFFHLLIIACMIVGSLAACSKSNNDSTQTKIPFSGVFTWEFEIPAMGKQLSVHKFYTDSIRFEMTGGAYTNSYLQKLVWYNADEQRCVSVGEGGGKDGIYFVMFFKNVTPNAMTIYKKQCTSKEEAMTIATPDAATEADHGWNVYYRQP